MGRTGVAKTHFASGPEVYFLSHRIEKWRRQGGIWNWEVVFIKTIMGLIKPGDVVFDIGAEEGEFSALFGLVAGGENMHLFEPCPTAWPNIRRVWEANGLTEPRCFHGFVVDHSDDGIAEQIQAGWPPSASDEICLNTHFGHYGKRPTGTLNLDDMPAVSIDDYVATVGIPPNVVTMDVEGCEALVVAGMQHVLRKYRPYVFVAIHPHDNGPADQDLWFAGKKGNPPLEPCELPSQQEHVFRLFSQAGYIGRWLAYDHESHWLFHHEDIAYHQHS